MTRVMNAVRIHKYGSPRVLVFEEVPRPEPEANELLIRVHVTSVNPADWQIRSGRRFKLKRPFSLILGFDVSGVVELIGSTVNNFKVGDAVYGMVDVRNGGAYAEYVVAPEINFAHKPKILDHNHAAALPVVALTAWQALFEAARVSAGQKVLIHAAAGGVGHIAVQLAKWKGAYVIGTASGQNENFLRKIGVDEFVNYRSTPFDDVVREVDMVLEAVNRDIRVERRHGETLEHSWRVLRKNGVLVSICDSNVSKTASAYGLRGKYILAQPNAAQLADIAELVDAGNVKPFISKVLPLKEARKAHKLSQMGHTRGKIVLQVIKSDF